MTYTHETQPCATPNPADSTRFLALQAPKNDRQGSLLDTSDYISPIDGHKVAILKHDNDHNLKHNLPNMTSPGRLMGQPGQGVQDTGAVVETLTSVNASQVLQLGRNESQSAKKRQLKRSSSKDSLIGTVIDGVRNLLGRHTLEPEEIAAFDRGEHAR